MKHSGEMVKQALKDKGMKQAELASRIGRDQTLVSRYFSGGIEVSDQAARAMAEVLDMDFEKLHRQLQKDRLKRRREKMGAAFKDVIDEEEKAVIGAVTLLDNIVTVPMLDSVPLSKNNWSAVEEARCAIPPDAPIGDESSFAVRVNSESMADDKIDEGDIVVVDTAAEIGDGNLVLAVVNRKPLLRKFFQTGETVVLQASGEYKEPVLFLSQEHDFEIIGRVALCIKFFI